MNQDNPTPGGEARIQEILNILKRNELGGANPHALQNAGTARSGYSVGVTQRDFAQMEPEQREEFIDLLEIESKLDEDTRDDLKKTLAKRGKHRLVEANKEAIDEALATPVGRAWIERVDRVQADRIAWRMQKVIDAARPENRVWLTSPTGRRALADNINQFGEPNRLKTFVSGGTARFNGKNHKLEGKLTTEKFVAYVRDYKYFQEHPKDLKRRLGGIAKAVNNPALDAAAEEAFYEIKFGPISLPRKPAFDDRPDAAGAGPQGRGATPAPQKGAGPAAPTPPPARPPDKPVTGLDRLQYLFGRPFQHLVKTASGRVPADDPAILHVDEIDALMTSSAYRQSLHPQFEKTQNTVRRWFEAAYPGPAQYDDTPGAWCARRAASGRPRRRLGFATRTP